MPSHHRALAALLPRALLAACATRSIDVRPLATDPSVFGNWSCDALYDEADPGRKRGDADIAAAAETALTWHALVPDDRVQLKVEKGWITLLGNVNWEYQRREAEKAVRCLTGVVGVSNAIALKPVTTPKGISDRVREALSRHADEESKHIEVIVKEDKVILRGRVDSWAERTAASTAAWSAPGFSNVVNELTVQW